MAGTTVVQMVFAATVTTGLLTAAYSYFVLYKKEDQENGPSHEKNKNGVTKGCASAVQKVPQHAEEQTARFRGEYTDMQEKFLKNGLDLAAISEVRKGFRGTEVDVTTSPCRTSIAPRVYTEDYPGGPLPFTSVRLLVLPLDRSHVLSSAADSVTREILKHLPFVKDVFRNRREDYHITIWHTSKAMYPCPDAMHQTGGVDPSLPPNERPAPTTEYIEKERRWCNSTVAAMPPPLLCFERFVFTDTGTLLMTWTDKSGQVEVLRQKCRAKFPGSLRIKQSGILHTSMLRVLSVQPLDEYIRQKIVETCEKWTDKVKGSEWEADKMWYVLESEFSTIAGSREEMPFKQ